MQVTVWGKANFSPSIKDFFFYIYKERCAHLKPNKHVILLSSLLSILAFASKLLHIFWHSTATKSQSVDEPETICRTASHHLKKKKKLDPFI